jgi:hypothetical protein
MKKTGAINERDAKLLEAEATLLEREGDSKLFQSLVGNREPIRSIQLLKQGNSPQTFA